jgi:hypothetical protein
VTEPAPAEAVEPNPYRVVVREDGGDWEVVILDPEGEPAWTRRYPDHAEAETLASTVRQHVYWLSPAKFREYYKLADQA